MKTTFALSLLAIAVLGTLNCYTCRNKSTDPVAHTLHCSKHVEEDAAQDIADTAKETATRVGHAARKGALKTVNTVSETAQKIGHAVKEGTLDAKDSVAQATDKAKRS